MELRSRQFALLIKRECGNFWFNTLSHRDPIVVACHILHVENYAALVRRRFEGGGLVTAKFVMRADDVQPVEVIKEYEDAEKGEVLACFEALTSLRSLLMSKD